MPNIDFQNGIAIGMAIKYGAKVGSPTPPPPPIPDDFVINVTEETFVKDGYAYGEFNHSFNLVLGSVYKMTVDIFGEQIIVYIPAENIEIDGQNFLGLNFAADGFDLQILDLASYDITGASVVVKSGTNTSWKSISFIEDETVIPYTVACELYDYPTLQDYFVYMASGNADTGLVTYKDMANKDIYGVINKVLELNSSSTYLIQINQIYANLNPMTVESTELARSTEVDGYTIIYIDGSSEIQYLKIYPNCSYNQDVLQYDAGKTAFRINAGVDDFGNLNPIAVAVTEQA